MEVVDDFVARKRSSLGNNTCSLSKKLVPGASFLWRVGWQSFRIGSFRRPLWASMGGEWHDRGTAELKQKDFGITPIRLRRHVRVKIQLRLGFDIVGR